jgi:hypothetical protein
MKRALSSKAATYPLLRRIKSICRLRVVDHFNYYSTVIIRNKLGPRTSDGDSKTTIRNYLILNNKGKFLFVLKPSELNEI